MGRDGKRGELRGRRAPIEMSGEEFRRLGHRLVDSVAGFLDSLRDRPVNRDERPSEVRALLPQGGLPRTGEEPGPLLEQTTELLMEHSLFNGHPRFLGYITSSAAQIVARHGRELDREMRPAGLQ